MRNTTRLIYCAAAITVLAVVISCTQSIQNNNSYILRLKNRGIVPLSTENPYIAANALINKEMERSPELKGFIEHSGAPNAIRVEQGLFSPLYIEFYYTAKVEFFTAEENNGIWLINGPFQIDSNTLADIKKVLIFNSSKTKVVLPPPAPTVPGPLLPKSVATQNPPPTAISTAALFTPTPLQKNSETINTAAIFTGSIQTLAERYGKSKAETTPKGDIVHYVSSPGETLAMISRWYTFDAGNQNRLMRINHLENNKALSLGDSIVIPSYLVKNKNILNQEALSALEAAVSDGSVK